MRSCMRIWRNHRDGTEEAEQRELKRVRGLGMEYEGSQRLEHSNGSAALRERASH